ncbi:MAG: hypothetical protein ABI634_05395 [Acidobacteriota bacterium]
MTQAIKWTALASVAGALLVYRSVRQRVAILRQALTEDEMLTSELEDSFPASDPPSHTPTLGSQIAH